jgi:LAO/AO transport system kinase
MPANDGSPGPIRRELGLDDYLAGVRGGNRTILARAISLVESTATAHAPIAEALLSAILPFTGGAHRIGVSGPPGAGKSTLIQGLGQHLTHGGHRVAVLAVDPSSAKTGGSILGDKTRMQRLAVDPNAFIRPSPSSGTLGGVARKTREALLLCEAAGFDRVVVETVGVGQSEALVAGMVDSFLVLQLTGAGDELQGIKRGISEHADIIAITKADGDNQARAERTRQEWEKAMLLFPSRTPGWSTPVMTCSATEGLGVADLAAALERHRLVLKRTGAYESQREAQRLAWLWQLVEAALLAQVREHEQVRRLLPKLERGVRTGEMNAVSGARQILAACRDLADRGSRENPT